MNYLFTIVFNIIFSLLFSDKTEEFTPNNFVSQDSVPKTCVDCHNTLIENKFKHAPAAEACDNCHNSNDNTHPAEGVKGFTLGDNPPTLCFYCHEEYSKKNIHAPAEGGECLVCHNVHSSKNPKLLTASSSNILCFQCHELEIPIEDVVHSPVKTGACHECHDPHQSDNGGFLKDKAPALCFSCHDDVKQLATANSIHAPFDEDCFTCHQPHSGKGQSLLTEQSPSLCYMCHGELQELVDTAKFVHQPMADKKSCSNCHNPHGSSNNTLLSKNEKDLCLSCHNRTYTTESGKTKNIKQKLKTDYNIHAPVEEGCVLCHNPHASQNTAILNGSFPSGNYATAKEENFALCFECHDSGLLLAENTEDATNFRHGTQNMHYLHIKGNKGKSCQLCHDVHGAKNEHLISEKVPFGNWEMDMNYKVTEFGGSCATGCHGEKTYNRNITPPQKLPSDSTKTTATTTNKYTNRYQSYTENIYEIDSSVIIMNALLEEKYQREQDSLKALELLAENKKDDLNSTSDTTIVIHDTITEDPIAEKQDIIEIVPIADNSKDEVIEEIPEPKDEKEIVDSIKTEAQEVLIVENKEPVDTVVILSDEKPITDTLLAENKQLSTKDTLEPVIEEKIAEVIIPEKDTNIQVPVTAKETEHDEDTQLVVTNEEKTITEEEPVIVDQIEVQDLKTFPNILFAFSNTDILANNVNSIALVANYLKANPDFRIKIIGHTDSTGPSDYNQFLSLERANAAKKTLINQGIAANRINTEGKGESEPLNSNSNRKERAVNRRVEFIISEGPEIEPLGH